MNEVQIQAGPKVLFGNLIIPENAEAVVLFVHGSGSSRHSPRNRFGAGSAVGGVGKSQENVRLNRLHEFAGLRGMYFGLVSFKDPIEKPDNETVRHQDERAHQTRIVQ